MDEQQANASTGRRSRRSLIALMDTLRVLPDPEQIRRYVEKLRKADPERSPQELSIALANGAVWRLTGAGVVASLPGAAPGLGTAVQVGLDVTAFTGETLLMLRNLSALQLMIACLMGHDPAAAERRDELLIIWGLATGLVVPVKEAAKRVGTKVAVVQFNRHITGALLRRLNQRLGTTVLTKYGTKRGGVALGRLVPFGVGVLVGGGMNYVSARAFARSAVQLYTRILPNDEDLYVNA